jgi:hypothetical protein
MKTTLISTAILLSSLLFLLTGCNSGYRADIQSMLSPAALPYLKPSKLIQVSSYDTSGGNRDRIYIAPGKKVDILKVEGPGMIVRIYFNIWSQDPYFLRRVVIRMYWDNEEKPSVEVPFGDFFGCGFQYRPYTSQYLGMSSGGYYCYFPMPFERQARIEIANDTRQEIQGFAYQIEYQKFEGALESDVSYFHAFWNRNILTNYDSNYVLLKTQGKGHIVGLNMNIQSYNGQFQFLQGDDMFYIDGEKRPSIHGTGTEDYFSSGGNFSYGEFDGPHHGLIYKNDSLGQIAAYRLHITDPIPFKKSIILTFEHGNRNEVIADYSSTVYWYQMESHQNFPPFPIPTQRIPLRIAKPVRMLEAEKLTFNMEGLRSKVQDMSEFGPDWGNGKQLLIEGRKGASFRLDLHGLKEPLYNIDLYYTRGPEYGNADVYLNNIKVGEIHGYSPHILPTGKLTLSHESMATGWSPREGSFSFRFVVSGKDSLSKGHQVGIDGLCLEPHRIFIPEWYILGPFPNPVSNNHLRRGLDSIYVPEVYTDLKKEYPLSKGKTISWKYYQTPSHGYFSLSDKIYPNEQVVAFAVTHIFSPDRRKVILFAGSDDGCKIFLNNKVVYRFSGERIAEPDQAEVTLELIPGWNKLMFKVENNRGQFAFFARLLDVDKKLVIRADRSLENE